MTTRKSTTRTPATKAPQAKSTAKSKPAAPRPRSSKFDPSRAALEAIQLAMATVELGLDGTVVFANDRFLSLVARDLGEVRGNHHSTLVEPAFAKSDEYQSLWKELAAGKARKECFPYATKNGDVVWFDTTLCPMIGTTGKAVSIMAVAADVTAERQHTVDCQRQIAAVNRSQMVIEFTPEGIILNANPLFLSSTGYSSEEIVGRHHRMFVPEEIANSEEYIKLWERLRLGRAITGTFERRTKDGKQVWLRATYSPIQDDAGNVLRVVKFATDATDAKKAEQSLALAQARDTQHAIDDQRKVAEVLEAVSAIAEGRFDIEIPSLGDDPIGQVATALRTAVQSMQSTLLEVRDVASTVSDAAEQLTSASREISSGAQTQASSLEETASSLEEITSTVKQNTDNAQQARQLATGSRDIAEKGGAVVSEAVKAMGEINHASKKIADIITTIDEIAFQTNLLALNAAVEAARAGEQGRGFAVVAAEVRSLAQRSASAAKEIKTLIQDSVRKVDNGTDLVNRSGQTLGEIVNSVKRVTDIVSEIAAASREQLVGIEQVNKAVAQMDRVTQGNAAQTEELSGTSASLLAHAESLADLVGRFRLGNDAPVRKVTRQEGARVATPPIERMTKSIMPTFELPPAQHGVLEF